MTLRERHEQYKAEVTAKVLAASNKGGYGVGYATTTVKKEVAYAARKVAKAISSTSVAHEARIGYYAGAADADYAFAERCAKRREKARAKSDEKAAKAAAEELMNEICNN